MTEEPIKVSFDASEFEKLGREFALHKYEVQEAIRRAVKTTTQRLRDETATEFVRVSGLRIVMVRRRLFLRYKYADGYGRVWFGLNPLSLSKLSPRKTATGVRAGPVNVPGGFMPGGEFGRSVFVRRGPDRLPIDKRSYNVRDIGEEVVRNKVEPIIESVFMEEFKEELLGALSGSERKGRRASKKFISN